MRPSVGALNGAVQHRGEGQMMMPSMRALGASLAQNMRRREPSVTASLSNHETGTNAAKRESSRAPGVVP